MKDSRLRSPRFVDFATPTNPHGLRFVEGEAGQTGGGTGQTGARDTGQQGQQQGQAGAGATNTPPAAPAPTPADLARQKTGDGQGTEPGKVEDLPEWAQKIISEARDGEAKARTGAKEKAAEEARKALAQEIGKAIGIVKDEGEQVDPAKITADLQAAQSAHSEVARELALYKAASTAGLDPTKLLDSRSFMKTVADLDPTDEAAVKAALDKVKDNPQFKTARAAGASSVDHAGGTGEQATRTPKSLTDALASAYGTH